MAPKLPTAIKQTNAYAMRGSRCLSGGGVGPVIKRENIAGDKDYYRELTAPPSFPGASRQPPTPFILCRNTIDNSPARYGLLELTTAGSSSLGRRCN